MFSIPITSVIHMTTDHQAASRATHRPVSLPPPPPSRQTHQGTDRVVPSPKRCSSPPAIPPPPPRVVRAPPRMDTGPDRQFVAPATASSRMNKAKSAQPHTPTQLPSSSRLDCDESVSRMLSNAMESRRQIMKSCSLSEDSYSSEYNY